METDETLVEIARTARQGDLRAFDELVRRHQAKVQTNCRYLSGNDEDARDLAQEVLVKTYFNLHRFEGRSQFGTWLNRIKVNHCLNHLRREKKNLHVDVETPGLESDAALHARSRADGDFQRREARELIGVALGRMSEPLRIALIMRDMDGLSYQEVADGLGVGLSAAKMRIKRAREEFRSLYESDKVHG